VGPYLVLVAGVEAEPASTVAPLRVSAGLRRRLTMPLPLKPPAGAEGLVFEDRNGNGCPDAGEPGLPGVGVRVGAAHTMTDADGRWTLVAPEAAGQPALLDPATLPADVLPLAPRPASGRTWMPVVRAASLALTLYLDENGNGTRDEGEAAPPALVVLLKDAQGNVRFADVDAAGAARLTGVAPGAYTLVLQTTGAAVQQRTVPVALAAGQAHALMLAAPSAERPVRFTRR
jgi:hypothetical protein